MSRKKCLNLGGVKILFFLAVERSSQYYKPVKTSDFRPMHIIRFYKILRYKRHRLNELRFLRVL